MKKWTIMMVAALFVIVSAGMVSAADYVGVAKCKMCHMKQFKSWEQTKMAKALDSLKPGAAAEAKTAAKLDPEKDYTTDAACLGCHTVNGKADMPGVQCESCHGAGSDYMKVMMTNRDYKLDEIKAKGLVNAPDEAACKKCHNEKSPFFKGFTYDKSKSHEHTPLTKKH
ncbi:MAG: hypothetical protein CO150_03865 [Nitrospirae bacterium CG_4_9_14_3_um_filter_53_35]|nr:MAG: hypothetical protein COT35_03175 [Nitrospirae bacterium CG08_land_8_20_14_0_20_52_24]PIV84622.1 MAG: hypothetical protein COW52_06600 [Nitrospirae bacterium CG17_big_fil_post_rev_8_21_14_2_50_50_9]PIW86114.1 MAG: hypothetical protein COZ95_01000 [Nitrospirae bacterium CG_4_8_14_3_um_filter_50_41]PIX84767.1 MAG: hypothetical protein COZ32_11955 [Nitrospirae bacterium CG_4_10_14_3_um_filter_53_41]PJA76062.1 MAG: hypothetical protein CO150_03865 [Nitrospirae bacterium CG_4_9_14_3_um_filter